MSPLVARVLLQRHEEQMAVPFHAMPRCGSGPESGATRASMTHYQRAARRAAICEWFELNPMASEYEASEFFGVARTTVQRARAEGA